MKRRIIAMLLLLAMTMSVTVTASAEGTDAALITEAAHSESGVEVAVSLKGCDGVTNGRFLVSYDAGVLTLENVQASDAYAVNSVNTETAGTVALAWVGSSLTAQKTLMLTLKFKMNPENISDTTVTVQSDGIYAGTAQMQVAAGSATVPAEYGQVVDKTALEECIAEAEKLEETKYTEKSFAAVKEALTNAKSVLADENATREEVDAAYKALSDAMAKLELKNASGPGGGPGTGNGTGTGGGTGTGNGTGTGGGTGAGADTGDDSMVGLFMLLAVMSLAAVTALFVVNKRRNAA